MRRGTETRPGEALVVLRDPLDQDSGFGNERRVAGRWGARLPALDHPSRLNRGKTMYYTLVASLPHLPSHFDGIDRPPITGIRLRERLKMLKARDLEVVEQVLAFLLWDRQHRERTEEEVIASYEQLMHTIASPLVRHIVAFRLDVRTIMSGLRRRRKGLAPPKGVGQWVRHIARNWDHPDFNLGLRHPWIARAQQALDDEEFVEVERQVLEATWHEWVRLSERYHFSFETVILYLVRWEILNRWSHLDAERGHQRFDRLLEETLGEYNNTA